MLKIRNVSYERKRQRNGYIFILPWMIGAVFMFMRPLVNCVIYSFSDIAMDKEVVLTYAGLKHFKNAFITDATFLPNLTSSLTNLLYQVPLILVFSLAVAYVLNAKFRGCAFFKSLFFLPVIIASGVVIKVVRGDGYAQLLNNAEAESSLFKATSISKILIQSGLDLGIVNLIVSATNNIFDLTWKSGVQILIFIAAFKSVPVAMYEACIIEGATGWEAFWKVTFPMISPMLLTNLVYTIIDTFTDYSNPVISQIASNYINISYSSAMSFIYFIITFAIIMVIYFFVNKHVFYNVD